MTRPKPRRAERRTGLSAMPWWAILDVARALPPEQRVAHLATLGQDQIESILDDAMNDNDSVLRDQIIGRYIEIDPQLGRFAHDAVARRGAECRSITPATTCDAVQDLHRRVMALQQPDGSWPGGDVVNVLCEWFTDHGITIDD